jgi:hypothetical protein
MAIVFSPAYLYIVVLGIQRVFGILKAGKLVPFSSHRRRTERVVKVPDGT